MGKQAGRTRKQGGQRDGKTNFAKRESAVTDSEDIVHEMLAAASNDGGRGWKKKKKLLLKKESARLSNAVSMRAASATSQESNKALLKESFFKKFWRHKDDQGTPSDEMKLMRRLVGVRVAGRAPPPVSGVGDSRLPDIFKEYFKHIKALKEATPVQMQAWPCLLNGTDTMVIAPTGSGKTLAYQLCVATHVIAQRKPEIGEGPLALVLVPTRELALQVKQSFTPLRRLYGIRTVALYGGLLPVERKAQLCEVLENAIHVLVSTPGRLVELCSGEFVMENEDTPKVSLSRVTMLIVDEVDRILSLGFESQLKSIVGKLRSDRQTACFSATFPAVLRQAAQSLMPAEPTVIRVGTVDVSSASSAPSTSISTTSELNELKVPIQSDSKTSSIAMSDTLTHEVAILENEGMKLNALTDYFKKVGDKRIIVFCNKITTVDALAKVLFNIKKVEKDENGKVIVEQQNNVATNKKKKPANKASLWRIGVLHGRLPQAARMEALKSFSSGKLQILLATDVAGRGVHVSGLDHVVNYDLPHSTRVHEMYPHRVGRAGRSGRNGHALTFVVKPNIDRGELGSSGAMELATLFSSNGIKLEEDFQNLVLFLKERTEEYSKLKALRLRTTKKSGDDSEEEDEEEEVVEKDYGSALLATSLKTKIKWTKEEFREEVFEFYNEKAPEKLGGVDDLVEKYWGKVDPTEFVAALHAKYKKE